MNTDDLRKAGKVIYLACEESVADDISFKLMQAASEIDRLRTVVSVYEREIDDLKEFLENR